MSKKWTAEKVEEILALMKRMDVRSLDAPIKTVENDLSEYTLSDMVEDLSPGPQEILEEKDMIQYLLRCIDELPPREQAVIKHRYGFVDGKFHTLDEIGQMYSVTRERVRQLECKALDKLRKKIKVRDKHSHVYDI